MKKEPSWGQKIKERAAEKEAGVTLPVDFTSSSKFCEDDQIKQSDLSTGVPEGTSHPEGFFGYTDKALVPTMPRASTWLKRMPRPEGKH